MAAHGGSAASSALKGLIQQFTAITGASESVGKHMLEACNNNLEMAVTMFLDGGGIAEEPSTSSAAVSTVRPHTEDEVRAPIPQKQEILVEPEPLFGAPKRRRPARSIFDGFRDFQTETIRQEQELRNGGAIDKKLTTLADLFRPPIDLMHKGSFETAKECGQMQNKWLMINIQNVQDFACQCLNRDVWSNEAVKNIIREHFIFWQVYHDSEEGQRYIQFYKLADFPYVSILDPRTGQKLVEWHQLDVTSFLDQVTGFLGEHGQLDGHSTNPPQKCSRSESLIDASEDSQMEAAIRASLQETHFDSSQVKQDSRSDEESESELFSGSEEFISVCGSDDDDESENPAKSRKSPHKDLGFRKEESRRPPPEPPTRTEPGTTSNHRVVSCIDAGILEESADKPESAVEGLDVNGPKAQLMLRYPDGKREQISLPEQAKLLFTDELPESSKEELKAFVAQGCLVGKTSLQSALNVADPLSFGLSCNDTSWLQIYGIAPCHIQHSIEVHFHFLRKLVRLYIHLRTLVLLCSHWEICTLATKRLLIDVTSNIIHSNVSNSHPTLLGSNSSLERNINHRGENPLGPILISQLALC
ncbi:UBX domain-containing protein 7 isoform X2 [Dermochelys coriacea]|uniref:UBX domain-containing protein 7 isoform X2 n=1 Tax=Dermochelys coriacea TaxID=27794 RepID=UPI001CAA1CD4|nr:UBX domain-containing protein 7 isoform X2 [Dermochelys coriacea]